MRKTLTIALIMFAASPSGAYAACNQASMAGTWTYSAINAQNMRNSRSLLVRCEFEIDDRGTIDHVSCDSENSEAEFQGVRFVINPSCAIQLETIACGTGQGTYAGQLSRDRSVASGSALCGVAFNVRSDHNFFNLVKR